MKEAQKECINNLQNKQNPQEKPLKNKKKYLYKSFMKMKFVMLFLLLLLLVLHTMGMQIDWLDDV